MNAALLLPAALAALAALLIPLVIHIARRTESRTVDFAALRWLEARPKPRQRPRIDERLLLALRLLLLAALALWLARPVILGAADDRKVVAVAPGVSSGIKESLAGAGDRVVWLTPGFPRFDGSPPASTSGTVSLIRQLDAELPPATPLTLVVPEILEGADAQRPILSRKVEWVVTDSTLAAQRPSARPVPVLVVRHAPGVTDPVRYFRAAATAWAAPGTGPRFQAAPAAVPLDRGTVALVWTAPGALPEPVVNWIEDGGTALLSMDTRLPIEGHATVAWRDAIGLPLATAETAGRGRVIRLTRPLEPSALPELLEADFPDTLLGLLTPSPAPSRVAAAAHAPLEGASPYDQPPFDLRPWLALVIALLFGAERWMATRSARAVAP
ncbi:BatA domain-containing protein [Brevundimonas variabilis]|uniref:Aerotolerance regulator N-terminal domain-containing protein n=1 Tax=Brevundimonas variabilis TaxID=74312 RepID=A0A7W9CL33_9CAUL|nr:BatA domain-containing protein [Brevundimonas variabilis]MBB5747680.1 hypothetical protein [Brevundimonas variabilis]